MTPLRWGNDPPPGIVRRVGLIVGVVVGERGRDEEQLRSYEGSRAFVLAMPPRTVKPEKIVARNTLDRGSASPVGYALRTPTPSAMFGRTNKGSVASMAIAIRSNGQISYPFLSAGAFTAVLAVREPGPAGASAASSPSTGFGTLSELATTAAGLRRRTCTGSSGTSSSTASATRPRWAPPRSPPS